VRQAQNIVAAAKAAGTVKNVVVSTVHKAAEQAALVNEKDGYPFLKYYYKRKAGVEKVVTDAGFEKWTVLRPDCRFWGDLSFFFFIVSCFFSRDIVPSLLRQSVLGDC
jgi:hypothetical protein